MVRRIDERGYFARTWCREEFRRMGIDAEMVQASVSHNSVAGTLRGMHFAWPPAREGKLVSCERGSIFDVIVDLRPGSATYLGHFCVVLHQDDEVALYIPPGVAHGFQTLADETHVLYLNSEAYRPDLQGGIRFDDPAFGIPWPRAVSRISERDLGFPDFQPDDHVRRYRQNAA